MADLEDTRPWTERDPLLPAPPASGHFGATLAYHASVTSTNDLVATAAAEGAAEGLIVCADEQSQGRGRHGRRWDAPPGTGLLCSLLLRPALPPALAPRAGLYVAVAASAAVERTVALPVALKWPNDLLICGRKVAGVLAESGIVGARLDYVVVGIGINVHWHPADAAATSLDAAAGRIVPRRSLLAALLAELERWRPLLDATEPDRLLAAWRGRLITVGRAVEVRGAARPLRGVAVGVAADGGLIVESEGGRTEVVHAGDVTLRPA